jgi:hypothetical protein
MDYNPTFEEALIRAVVRVEAEEATVDAEHMVLIWDVAASAKLITLCQRWHNVAVLLERFNSITPLLISCIRTMPQEDLPSLILTRQRHSSILISTLG